MADVTGLLAGPLRRTAIVIGAIVLATVGVGHLASGQDRGVTVAKDAIFARKILMDAIGRNMDELEGMTESSKAIDLAEGNEHADNISIMLMSFPHLFAANTNQWKAGAERDPGRDTYASPTLWTNYADFYAQAANASKVAYKASRAKQEDAFKTFVADLRAACDSCHAVYLKSDQ